MGVSNNFLLNNNSGSVGNIDLSGLTGLNTSYRFFKEGFYKLNPNKPLLIVPPTPAKVNREITIYYRNDLNPVENANIKLFWGSRKNLNPKIIELGGKYKDTSDGGIGLVTECEQTAIIEVIVRQDSEINYPIGNYFGDDEMPVKLEVRHIIETGTRYSMPPIIPTTIGEDNLRKIIDSNNGVITGVKVWAIDQFQDGKEYNFTINANGKIRLNTPVNVLLVRIEDLMKCFASLDASDNGELDQLAIANDLIGWIKSNSFYSKIDLNESTTFKLKPTRTRYLIAFDAGNPATPNYTDTVIGTYQPNTFDPYEGGVFTFLGF